MSRSRLLCQWLLSTPNNQINGKVYENGWEAKDLETKGNTWLSWKKKIASKVNLFNKIKSLRFNHIKINSILFESLIRPVLDYAFIPFVSPTQRILDNAQKIQNRILRAIKYFTPRTLIADIHSHFKIKSIKAPNFWGSLLSPNAVTT